MPGLYRSGTELIILRCKNGMTLLFVNTVTRPISFYQQMALFCRVIAQCKCIHICTYIYYCLVHEHDDENKAKVDSGMLTHKPLRMPFR